MKYIIAALLPGLLTYLCIAFIAWQLDPALWAVDTRLSLVVFWMMSLMPSLTIASTIKS